MVERGLAAESSAKAPKIPQDRRKFSSCKGLKSAGSVSALAYVRDYFSASTSGRAFMPAKCERQEITLTLWLQIHPLPPRRRKLRIACDALFMLEIRASPLTPLLRLFPKNARIFGDPLASYRTPFLWSNGVWLPNPPPKRLKSCKSAKSPVLAKV